MEQDSIDILALLKKCIKNWYWFAISVVVCVAAGLTYWLVTPSEYTVNASIILREDEMNRNSSLASLAKGELGNMLQLFGMGKSAKDITNEIEILSSRTVIQNVVKDLGLQIEYSKKEGLQWIGQYPNTDLILQLPEHYLDNIDGTTEIYIKRKKNSYSIKIKTDDTKSKHAVLTLNEPIETAIGQIFIKEICPLQVGDKYEITVRPVNLATSELKDDIEIKRLKKDNDIITLSITTNMPTKGKMIISKIIELYNLESYLEKNEVARNRLQFYDERLELMKQELDSIENNMQGYKTKENLTDLESDAKLYIKANEEYHAKLVEVETQINLVDYIKEYITDEKNSNSAIPANGAVSDPSLAKGLEMYNETLLKRLQIARSATDQNPMIAMYDSQLEILRENVIMTIESVREGLAISKRELEKQERDYSKKINSIPTQENNYRSLMRSQAIAQTLYLFIYQHKEEQELILANIGSPVRVIDAPQRSAKKVAPKGSLILLIALVLGLLLPFVVIYLIEMYSSTTKQIANKKENEESALIE